MKKHILMIIYCLVLCCTVTFAWILEGNPIVIDSIMFDYVEDNMLSIANVGVDVDIWFRQGEEYVEPKDFDYESMTLTPHSKIPFKIYFDYQSSDGEGSVAPIRLSLVGITVSDPKLLDALFIWIAPDESISTSGGHGNIYKCFNQAVASGEGEDITYRLDIYGSSNKLFIPHNDAMERVNPWDEGTRSSLDCYFYLDLKADESYQDLEMNIGYFRIEQ